MIAINTISVAIIPGWRYGDWSMFVLAAAKVTGWDILAMLF